MARKFFHDKVHNTKKTIINLVIIGVCIIGVIICFIITSNFQGENQTENSGTLSLKKDVTIEINEKFANEIFFSKIENVSLDDIKVTYPDNYDVSKPGSYKVDIEINGKKYNSNLIVVDTEKPELTLKEITISENSNYVPKTFVENCQDNSKSECIIDFYSDGIDEEGNKIDYSNYKTAGTYSIKISAKDESGNETVQETKLIINKSEGTVKPPVTEPTTCKYGKGDYNKDEHLIAVDITSNNCAVSLDLYKDSSMTAAINKLMDTETIKIKRDIEALKLNGTLALNRKITAVTNTTGDGVVGYELQMTVNITNNGKTETVADYKIDSAGKREFITNLYNIK